MKKGKYVKPEMKVILLQSKTQLLAGSPTFGLYNDVNDAVDEEL